MPTHASTIPEGKVKTTVYLDRALMERAKAAAVLWAKEYRVPSLSLNAFIAMAIDLQCDTIEAEIGQQSAGIRHLVRAEERTDERR